MSVQGLTSVVIVAADSGPLLRACIDSVLAAQAAVEIVLVDNASSDGEIERVRAAHAGDARLRILRNEANIGFGPACNRGAVIARGDVLLFLNPDCDVPPGFLDGVREALGASPTIGLFGVTVRDVDGRPARGSRRRDPLLRRALASLSGLSRFEARCPGLAGVEMPPFEGASDAIEDVEAVSGACMALPRRSFDRVGGFDEAYFLHVEDLDLCRRVRDADLRVALAHGLSITHVQGSSSRSRPLFVARHKHRGMWRYFTKFDPAARNPLLRECVRLGIWMHYAALAPMLMLRGRVERKSPAL
jgi:GT2 family glycosyltransferase